MELSLRVSVYQSGNKTVNPSELRKIKKKKNDQYHHQPENSQRPGEGRA